MLLWFERSYAYQTNKNADSVEVVMLNKQALANLRTDTAQAFTLANKAAGAAGRSEYFVGLGESYRILGILYSLKPDHKYAFEYFSKALKLFGKRGYNIGVAKVKNDLGTLYKANDPKEALTYFSEALPIAQKAGDSVLIATINVSIADVNFHQKRFAAAYQIYKASLGIFSRAGEEQEEISCAIKAGACGTILGKYQEAQSLLTDADTKARELNNAALLAEASLALADLYTAQEKFDLANKYLGEAGRINGGSKLRTDLLYTAYKLEFKKGNFKKAAEILNNLHLEDIEETKTKTLEQINLVQKKGEQDAELDAAKALLSQNKYSFNLFAGAAVLALLAISLVMLLILNVKRKAETNKKLSELNAEVSRQKDNLNRINHHLEEIIDERTKDLQIKNKKLSEYSSYLSHQIRGPIATLKGLMNLEKEGLVDKKECINMMNKCVSEIDDKIIDMSDMLHDPDRAGF
ncbi:hypothetical protein GCM10028827_25490 [Mucilaginibacter myungsuensis]